VVLTSEKGSFFGLKSFFRRFKGVILGITSWSIAFFLYLLYEHTHNDFLPPLGLLFLGIGAFLLLHEKRKFKTLEELIVPLIAGIFVFWIFLITHFDEVILHTKMADEMVKLAVIATIHILRLLNYEADYAFYETADGDQMGIIYLENPSKVSAIYIDARCSGVHSTTIFLIVFAIMILYIGRHASSKKRVGISFLIGGIGTLTTNWIRLTIISLTGYYYGYNTMMRVHDYLGFLLFLLWMTIFWYFAINYMLKESNEEEEEKKTITTTEEEKVKMTPKTA